MDVQPAAYFAHVITRCFVAGEPTNSLDFSVRHFRASSEEEVQRAVEHAKPVSYLNDLGETVEWRLLRVMSLPRHRARISMRS